MAQCWQSLSIMFIRWCFFFLIFFGMPAINQANTHTVSDFCQKSLDSPTPKKSLRAVRPLPSQRLQNSTLASQNFWESYKDNFQKSSRALIESKRIYYLEALQERHPYTEFLKKLGFEITEKTVVVPDLISIMDSLEQMIKENLQTGKMAPEDVLWPEMLLVYQSGGQLYETKALPGDNINFVNDTALENSENWEYEATEDPEVFAQTLADGHFPLGHLQELIGGNSLLIHDLAHMYAMIEHPEYMTAVKNAYKKLVKNNTDMPQFHEKMKEGSLLSSRVFLALESLVVTAKGKASEMANYLGVEELIAENPNPSRGEFEEYYESLSTDKVREIIDNIVKNYSKQFTLLGGVQLDIVTARKFQPTQLPFRYLFNKIQSKGVINIVKYEELARFAKFSWNTKDMSITEWVNLFLTEDPYSNPLYYELLREGEIFSFLQPGEEDLLDVLRK